MTRSSCLTALFATPPAADQPVLIAGPTASGKSALALEIAEAQDRVIVNADALQVHDTWRVLSARPPAEDESRVPHLLYGHVSRAQEYSVGHWLREVRTLLDKHTNPVIIGGTGLYFSALTDGLAEIPAVSADIRAQADARLQDDGLEALVRELDPETAAKTDLQNPARVQRAWEVLRATGKGLAAWQADTPPGPVPLSGLPKQNALMIDADRDWLNARIAQRFDLMLDQGALDEARAALSHWPADAPSPTAPLWTKAIGAPELIAHLQGHISLDEAREAATLATRQYAKRQRSWFRARMKDWTHVPRPAP